jgi:very-short-patch-repair endonuclease
MAVDRAVDRRVLRLSRRQNGNVTRQQLRQAGLTPAAIKARMARGYLVPMYRGVYAAGDPELVPLAWEAAAVLSLGAGAALSHRSAAAVWSFAEPARGAIDVTVAGRKPRPRPRVRVHRVVQLAPEDFRSKSNIAITAPARTVIDYAVSATARELERAIAEARVLRLLTDRALRRALSRAPPNHPGAVAVRALLDRQADPRFTRSEGEREMLSLIRAAKLPEPEVNARLNGLEVDFLWRAERLVLEVDGYGFHGHRGAFETDRERSQILAATSIRVSRATWRQLVDEPFAVIARLAQAIGGVAG